MKEKQCGFEFRPGKKTKLVGSERKKETKINTGRNYPKQTGTPEIDRNWPEFHYIKKLKEKKTYKHKKCRNSIKFLIAATVSFKTIFIFWIHNGREGN